MILATTISSGTDRSTYPCQLPRLPGLDIAARYREPRIGGDFFDVAVTPNYLFLVMTDIAGERDGTQHVAAEVQDAFQHQAALFSKSPVFNESIATVEMLRAINGAIMSSSGGVRCSPTFLAVYNLTAHTLTYINAGLSAALLLQSASVQALDSAGIPLGLFTHLTHEPVCLAMQPGSRLVLLSKGILESRRDSLEFGMERACSMLLQLQSTSADHICSSLLESAEAFAAIVRKQHTHRFGSFGRTTLGLRDDEQDLTVLTLARY